MAVLDFDPKAMTIGDLEDFEDIVGEPMQTALSPKPVRDAAGDIVRDARGRPKTAVQPSTKAIKALVYLAGRRQNPAFSLDDARQIRVDELRIHAEEPADPKGGSASGA
ncbi:hypothetical protein [Parafrankia sp. EUN1f]|uniref:hypothetical protein n=1 Tax=Parafrankia sp. EUN1f TaxID=102897 RepID=UPI0001C4557D|nr:hypothetical protein [Parafrankia sp. EUN1f]EFC86468.1 hypothetical protein FrEUN1fDRAFT_0363 [Parafrankia sp. EUN1f]